MDIFPDESILKTLIYEEKLRNPKRPFKIFMI